MKEQTKGIVLVALIAVAAFVWYLERRESSASKTSSSQVDERTYTPLAVENPALQREKQAASRKTVSDFKNLKGIL